MKVCCDVLCCGGVFIYAYLFEYCSIDLLCTILYTVQYFKFKIVLEIFEFFTFSPSHTKILNTVIKWRPDRQQNYQPFCLLIPCCYCCRAAVIYRLSSRVVSKCIRKMNNRILPLQTSLRAQIITNNLMHQTRLCLYSITIRTNRNNTAMQLLLMSLNKVKVNNNHFLFVRPAIVFNMRVLAE